MEVGQGSPNPWTIHPSENARVASEAPYYSEYPALIDANLLHEQGITGAGVTIGFVDTGIFNVDGLLKDANGFDRLLAHYDAISDTMLATSISDQSGHGSHVSSIAMSSSYLTDPITTVKKFNGVAPGANLVVVKAFGSNGSGSYLDVIRGIDWLVTNKDAYNIRVINLSFSALPQSYSNHTKGRIL